MDVSAVLFYSQAQRWSRRWAGVVLVHLQEHGGASKLRKDANSLNGSRNASAAQTLFFQAEHNFCSPSHLEIVITLA